MVRLIFFITIYLHSVWSRWRLSLHTPTLYFERFLLISLDLSVVSGLTRIRLPDKVVSGHECMQQRQSKFNGLTWKLWTQLFRENSPKPGSWRRHSDSARTRKLPNSPYPFYLLVIYTLVCETKKPNML